MEFFTSWPLKHYFSLKLQPNINYYNIDEDTIISEQDAEKYSIKPYRKSDKYLLVGLSKTMGQVFKELGENKVPTIPVNIEKIIKQHQEQDDFFMSLMKKNQSIKADSSADTNLVLLKEELEKEISQLKTDLETERTLKEQLIAQQTQTQTNQNQNNDIKLEELNKLQNDNNIKLEELNRLQSDNNTKLQELNKLQNEVDNKLKSYDELQKNLQLELKTKEQECESKHKNLLLLETQLAEKKNNMEIFSSELSIKQDNLQILSRELLEKQNNIETISEQLSEKRSLLEKEISERNRESTSQSEILKEYEYEIEKYQKLFKDSDESKSFLENKLLLLEKQFETYFSPDSYQKLQSLLDDTNNKHYTTELNYMNQIDTLNSQLLNLQNNLASSTSQLQVLNDKLLDKDSEILSINSRLSDTSSLSQLDSFIIKSSAKSILLIFYQSSSVDYFLIPINELKPRHLNSLVFSHGVSLNSSPPNSIPSKSALSVIQAISPKNSSHDPEWSGIWHHYQIPLSEVCNFDQLQVFIVSKS